MKKTHIMMPIILAAVFAIGVAAQDCSPDGACDRRCINNTIDEFDLDCGVPEGGLYTKSVAAIPSAAKETEIEMLPGPPKRPCPQVKDGVCETTCEGVDLDCLCGDFECQEHESTATCPIDCRHEQNALCAIARDGYCDPECRPFDADCATQVVARTTRDVQARFDLPEHAVYTTLALILIVLCAIVIYLMHKAFEIKKEKGT